MFRLVSTGVDIDNRIRAATSVQIQHVRTKSFLILENALFMKSKKPEEPEQEQEEEKAPDRDPNSLNKMKSRAKFASMFKEKFGGILG